MSDDNQTRLQLTHNTNTQQYQRLDGAINPSGGVDLTNPRCLRPKRWTAVHIYFPRPLSKDSNRFIKLK